jgi:maleate isomerase
LPTVSHDVEANEMDTMAVSAIRSFPALSDGGPTRHGAIGLVALATDHVCELDLRQIIPQDRIPLYVGRIGFASEITVETLGAMRDGITAAASLILAGGRLDVLAYGCTSGTMVIGEDEVFARLRAARPGIACTSPPTAALAALKALGLRRIAVLTPYTEGVNRRVIDYFTARGLDIAAFGAFNKGSDAEIAAIAPSSIVEAAQALDAPDIDGIFLSCTGLRGVAIVEELEARLGKPVVTSNQAMAWHALRLAGHAEPVAGFGRLLRL